MPRILRCLTAFHRLVSVVLLAAVTLLTLQACDKPPQPAQSVTVIGAGSTFINPAMSDGLPVFRRRIPGFRSITSRSAVEAESSK